MEPTKLQKNAGAIADLRSQRNALESIQEHLKASYNSDNTNKAIDQLRFASILLLDRMEELGVTIKIEDGSTNA